MVNSITKSDDSIKQVLYSISDSNGTTVVKKGNKELFDENASTDAESSVEEDEIINLDPNDILINTVAESLSEAVKTEL